MKKLAMVVGALLALTLQAAAQGVGAVTIACNKSYSLAAGATSINSIVPAAGRTISWCGWTIVGGAATATVQLSYGTGTNCNTGNTPVTPAVIVPINAVLMDHQNWAFTSLPQSNDLCLQIIGTGPLAIMVYYSIN